MKRLLFLLLFVTMSAWAQDARMCGTVVRDADGLILRDAKVVYAFRKLYACPSTGANTGACPGWSVDHVIPLACGGCDVVVNMQWLPNAIKAGKYPSKDRWERQIYNSGTCTFKVQQ